MKNALDVSRAANRGGSSIYRSPCAFSGTSDVTVTSPLRHGPKGLEDRPNGSVCATSLKAYEADELADRIG